MPNPSTEQAAASSRSALHQPAINDTAGCSKPAALLHAPDSSQNPNNQSSYATAQAASTLQAQALHSNLSKPNSCPSSSLSEPAAKLNGNLSCLSEPGARFNSSSHTSICEPAAGFKSSSRTRLRLDRPPQMCRTPVSSQSPGSSLDPVQSSLKQNGAEQPVPSQSPINSFKPVQSSLQKSDGTRPLSSQSPLKSLSVQSSLNRSRGEQAGLTSASGSVGQSEDGGSDSRGYAAWPHGNADDGVSGQKPKPVLESEACADAAPWQVRLSPSTSTA